MLRQGLNPPPLIQSPAYYHYSIPRANPFSLALFSHTGTNWGHVWPSSPSNKETTPSVTTTAQGYQKSVPFVIFWLVRFHCIHFSA